MTNFEGYFVYSEKWRPKGSSSLFLTSIDGDHILIVVACQ